MIAPGADLPAVEVDRTGDGDRVSLSELVVGPTLLIVFKRSCPTTRLAMPVYDHWNGYAPGVALLAVSQDGPDETAELFDELGVTFPVVYDPAPYPLSDALGLVSVPSLVLVEDGTVTWTGEGWQTARAEELATRLAALSGTEPILSGMEGLPAWKPG